MEERDRILIERYLAQEMTATEKLEFENRIQQDALFRAEVEQYRLAIEALKLAQREELKDRFRQRDKILDKDNTKHISGRRSLWLLAAVVTGLLLLSWLLYYSFKPAADEEIITHQDSIEQKGEIPITDDSIETPKQDDDEMQRKPSKKRDSGKDLFAANFEPYMDKSMDVVVRGDEENLSPEERFLSAYAEGKYIEAISLFSSLKQINQQNDNLRFLYANALIQSDRIDESIAILTGIIQNNKAEYKLESYYYLALAYLKKENYMQTKNYLNEYLKQTDTKQKEKATRILTALN